MPFMLAVMLSFHVHVYTIGNNGHGLVMCKKWKASLFACWLDSITSYSRCVLRSSGAVRYCDFGWVLRSRLDRDWIQLFIIDQPRVPIDSDHLRMWCLDRAMLPLAFLDSPSVFFILATIGLTALPVTCWCRPLSCLISIFLCMERPSFSRPDGTEWKHHHYFGGYFTFIISQGAYLL